MAQNITYNDIKAAVQGLDPASAVEVAQIAQLAVKKAGVEGKNFDGSPSTSGVAGMQRLKGLLQNRTSKPFLEEKFIATIPAWSAKTYRNRDVVKNTVGGTEYMFLVCAATVAGGANPSNQTLVSTAAPTNIASVLPVADPGDPRSGNDYLGWLCIGPVRQHPTLKDEVTYTKSTTAPSLGYAWGDVTTADSPFRRVSSDRWSASSFWEFGAYMQPFTGFQNAARTTYITGYTALTFYTDETSFGWWDYQLQFISQGDTGIKVDDVEYHPSSPFWSDHTAGAQGEAFRTVSFTTKKWRKITIRPSILRSFYAQSADAIFIPADDDLALSWKSTGDSWFAGSANGPFVQDGYIMGHLARELALPMPMNNAIGSTGVLVNGNGTNYLARKAVTVADYRKRDWLFAVIFGSGNDLSLPMAAGYRQQWIDFLRQERSEMSATAPIFVTSIVRNNGTVDERTVELRAAIAAVGDPNIFVIDMDVNTPGGIGVLNTRNLNTHIGLLQGHPTEYGSMYLAKYLASQIRKIVLTA